MATATGWSVDYILEQVNYQTLIMMLSDAPRYGSTGNGTSAGTTHGASQKISAEREAESIEDYFVSNLKRH